MSSNPFLYVTIFISTLLKDRFLFSPHSNSGCPKYLIKAYDSCEIPFFTLAASSSNDDDNKLTMIKYTFSFLRVFIFLARHFLIRPFFLNKLPNRLYNILINVQHKENDEYELVRFDKIR